MSKQTLSKVVHGAGIVLVLLSAFSMTFGATSAFADQPVPDEKEATFYCNFFCGCEIGSDAGDDCWGGFCAKGRCYCKGWGIFMYCVE